ncbi:MAG: hypothetical protein IJH07_07765 [Ruminococcus sp.]|nr:hypothetical protein [Ruminococcus sp.]
MKNQTKILSVLLALVMALGAFTAVPLGASAAGVDPAVAGSEQYMSFDDPNGSVYVWENDPSGSPGVLSVITHVYSFHHNLILPTYLVDTEHDRDGGDRFYFADVDKNGLIEIIDATWIQRHAAGMEIPYTIE